ncbi:hypothetical protein INR49_009785 [Caranx melampygus]|nr:hypothetical protein INR49_009785 [Caranx melampygus]
MELAGKAAGCWEAAEGGMCADGNRWWFILEACWDTSTLHVPFCLPAAAKAGEARPSFFVGDRWSFLETGHSTVLSVCGVPLEQPRTNTVSFCWEHTRPSVDHPETTKGQWQCAAWQALGTWPAGRATGQETPIFSGARRRSASLPLYLQPAPPPLSRFI